MLAGMATHLETLARHVAADGDTIAQLHREVRALLERNAWLEGEVRRLAALVLRGEPYDAARRTP